MSTQTRGFYMPHVPHIPKPTISDSAGKMILGVGGMCFWLVMLFRTGVESLPPGMAFYAQKYAGIIGIIQMLFLFFAMFIVILGIYIVIKNNKAKEAQAQISKPLTCQCVPTPE